jgi:transposase-like protein
MCDSVLCSLYLRIGELKILHFAMRLLELAGICHDKSSAIGFLQQKGILPSTKLCSKGHNMNLSLGKEDRWRCRLRTCREDKALRKNNWLEGSRLPYRTIILFIYCWSFEMTTIKFCERELEISENTVIDWNNYLREVCASSIINQLIIIGGPGEVVEIDESCFSRRKYQVGRIYPTQWVFGGICRRTNECFLYAVPDRSTQTLIPIIKESIRPCTTIISDCWRGYDDLKNHPEYHHLSVNHSLNFVDPETGAHTQKIESTWRDAKVRSKRHFGTSRNMLDSYLCEFMWRKRLRDKCPFETILNDIVNFWKPE